MLPTNIFNICHIKRSDNLKKEGCSGFFNSQEGKVNSRLFFLISLIVLIVSTFRNSTLYDIFYLKTDIFLKEIHSHSNIKRGLEYY